MDITKLGEKKAKDQETLILSAEACVLISESLTSSKQKLFGEVNKMKKTLQKEFIWTNNGKIFIRQDENRPSFAFEFPEDPTKANK